MPRPALPMPRGELQVVDDFEAVPADVAQQLEHAGRSDFQAGLGWWRNLVQTVDFDGARPRLYVWRMQGAVVAVLPLLARRGAAGTALASLGNYYTTRWAPLLAAAPAQQGAGALQCAIAAVLRHESPVSALRCTALAGGSASEAALHQALRAAGCAVHPHHGFHNWVLQVRQSWPEYLRTRSGPLRTTLSRMSRRFAARGGHLQLVQGQATDGLPLDAAIAAYERVYAASWKQPEPHPRFMPGLVRSAAASGQLRMALAWLDGVPVAAQVWLLSGNTADIYKLAHDEAHKDLSPGSLLTALLMQHVMEHDRVQWVDYLSGDDAYKRLWMDELRHRTGLVAYPLNTAAGLAGALKASAGHAWRRLRRAAPAGVLDHSDPMALLQAGRRVQALP